MPSYGYKRRNTNSRSAAAGQKGGKDKGKGKEKGRWEVGTKGWVKEGFRQFGAHCARNQVGYLSYSSSGRYRVELMTRYVRY